MHSSDFFRIHKNVVDDYREFVKSFIHIKDDFIRNKVEDEIANGKFWPEPLIQFNPSFEMGDTLHELCNKGVLHSELGNIFSGYRLFRHQVEAIELGSREKDFVVTSGTGSGKSLTYIGTIFHHLLNTQKSQGIKAIIVYPMNALINSQTDEFNKCKDAYEKHNHKPFPVTFAQYTGQEGQDERQRILNELPDIILTNYMMLELILTRSHETRLRESIYSNLKFLVFDELHTYKGRQGADVSMLIRRIKSQCKNSIVCIGTSATMVSGGSIEEQKQKVADVANTIFGVPFTAEQIIIEYLACCFLAMQTECLIE